MPAIKLEKSAAGTKGFLIKTMFCGKRGYAARIVSSREWDIVEKADNAQQMRKKGVEVMVRRLLRLWLALGLAVSILLSVCSCGEGQVAQPANEADSAGQEEYLATSGEQPAGGTGSEEEEPRQEVTITSVKGSERINGEVYYQVAYQAEDAGGSQEGYMNADGGVITDKRAVLRYENNPDTGTFTLYDENGEATYTSPEEEGIQRQVQFYGKSDDAYLVLELRKAAVGTDIYIGMMNRYGEWFYQDVASDEWISENQEHPVDITLDVWKTQLEPGSAFYLGDGKYGLRFSGEGGDYIAVANAYSGGEILVLENVSNEQLQSHSGQMAVQQWDENGQKGPISYIAGAGETPLDVKGELLGANKNGFLIWEEDRLLFYDMVGSLQWTFDQYEYDDAVEPVFCEDYGGYAVVSLLDDSGKKYTGCINLLNGELVFKTEADGFVDGKYMLAQVEGQNCFINLLNGETVATASHDFTLDEVTYGQEGIYIIQHSSGDGTALYLYTPWGDEVVPYLLG